LLKPIAKKKKYIYNVCEKKNLKKKKKRKHTCVKSVLNETGMFMKTRNAHCIANKIYFTEKTLQEKHTYIKIFTKTSPATITAIREEFKYKFIREIFYLILKHSVIIPVLGHRSTDFLLERSKQSFTVSWKMASLATS